MSWRFEFPSLSPRTRRYAPSPIPTHISYEEILSQTRMTRRRAPVMGADPATSMIFFVHSYSEDYFHPVCLVCRLLIFSLTWRIVCARQRWRRMELYAADPDR